MMVSLTRDEIKTMSREQMITALIERQNIKRYEAELLVDMLTGNAPEELIGVA